MVTAGSTGFMGGLNDGAREGAVFNTLREGDKPTSAYPLILKDRDAHPVVVVNTDQQYTYVGHLLVTFDKDGHITTIDPKSGPVATDAKTIANLETLLGHSIVLPEAISTIFADLQNTAIIKDMFSVVGITEDTLNGRRADVRSRETNLARLLTDSVSWHINQTYPDTTFDGILISGGSIRDYIRTPNITKFGLASAFAFDNKFTLIELSAEQFLAALENGVSRAPKRDGRFPQIAGFHIEYDLNKPGISDAITLTKPSRLKSVKLVKSDGTNEVLVEDFSWVGEPTRTFKIVTNQYLATGADGYRAFETAANTKGKFIEDTKGERAIVADYIQHELKGKVNLKDPIDQPRLCPVE